MSADTPVKTKTEIGRRLRITAAGVLLGWRDSVLVLHLRGKIRRFCAVNFRPGYVRRQLSRRKGDCRQCGICCSLGNTCPMLHQGRHCMIYLGYRPKSCQRFPIDDRDIADVTAVGGSCGYSFTPEVVPGKTAPPAKS